MLHCLLNSVNFSPMLSNKRNINNVKPARQQLIKIKINIQKRTNQINMRDYDKVFIPFLG